MRSRRWSSEWLKRIGIGGYRRIQGALSNLGHEIARSTIADTAAARIEPAPERKRKTTWKEFLSRHWELIVAADFFTVEVWTRRGLQRFVVLFFIELPTRRMEIAGIAATVNGLWMEQIGCNLTDSMNGILNGKRYLIHDRDPLFISVFLETIASVGVESVKLPPQSPNLHAYAGRFVRSIKESCLDQMIFFGEGSLRKGIIKAKETFYSSPPRRRQGTGEQFIVESDSVACFVTIAEPREYFDHTTSISHRICQTEFPDTTRWQCWTVPYHRYRLLQMQALPLSLQLKDVIGPTVSFIAMLVSFAGAMVSLFYYRKNYALSKQNADRSVYMDGQKFLIEICKQLTSEPLLWCVYDDNPLQQQCSTEVMEPKFQSKLLAFAHLHLNMFEIVLAEAPNPKASDPNNHTNVWLRYLDDTLTRSSLIRKVLDEPESGKIWSAVLLEEYRKWKEAHKAVVGAAS